MDTLMQIVGGVVVLVWVVVMQLRTRELTAKRMRIAGILGVVGLVQVVVAASAHAPSALGVAAMVAGLAIGAGLGVARAHTVRVWRDQGRVWVRGGAATAALWVAGMAVHVGLDVLVRAAAPADEPLNAASVLLFVAVSLGAQALVQVGRARALSPVAA